MNTLTRNQSMFVYWVNERQKILIDKMAFGNPPPWSQDPIFQTTYFCNVRREDDKVTRWIRQNWNLDTMPFENITAAMVCSRLFNSPDTLVELGPPKHGIDHWIKHIKIVTDNRKKNGLKNFNGAYIVSTQGAAVDKVTHCCSIIRNAHELQTDMALLHTLEDKHKLLMTVKGLGSFLAAQVIADLKYTKGTNEYTAPDKMTFSAAGPGSLRGLGWFWRRGGPLKPPEYKTAILEAWVKVQSHLICADSMCMQDFQNCMCEFDKYARIYYGKGKSKRKYQGN